MPLHNIGGQDVVMMSTGNLNLNMGLVVSNNVTFHASAGPLRFS